MRTHTITIKESWLTDGSDVYTIYLHDENAGSCVHFDAIDRRAAYKLADDLKAGIEANALASCEIKDHTYA